VTHFVFFIRHHEANEELDFCTTLSKPACGADLSTGIMTSVQENVHCDACRKWILEHQQLADTITAFRDADRRMNKAMQDLCDAHQELPRAPYVEEHGTWHQKNVQVLRFFREYMGRQVVVVTRYFTGKK
jgi:hypothetical protein